MNTKKVIRKSIAQILIVVMLSTLVFIFPNSPLVNTVSAATGAVGNTDFESGDLTSWTRTGTVAVQTAGKHGGAYSTKLTVAASNFGSNCYRNCTRELYIICLGKGSYKQ